MDRSLLQAGLVLAELSIDTLQVSCAQIVLGMGGGDQSQPRGNLHLQGDIQAEGSGPHEGMVG